MISKIQFLIMCELIDKNYKFTQRNLAENIGCSIGSVNKAINLLVKEELIGEDMSVTVKGNAQMEPFRVKRAIFIAAGFGSRLVPLTFNTPKPLIRVFGKPMIEYLLDAIAAVGIDEIIIVRGYLGEQFDVLKRKYKNIQFIDNKDFSIANNISSALKVKDLMQNAYVLEADLVLSNPNLITKYQYSSNYLGVPVDKTDDWCFKVSDGAIRKLQIGGSDCYHMYGISYWNAEDGAKLSGHIETTYNMPGGKERYWDQVALEYFAKEYNVAVRTCTFDDIVEIDSFADLKKIDKTYNC